MPPQAERNEIVSNAARLLRDAKLLVDNERYASAFALSVLALEEIGKVVLELWGASQPVHKSGKRPSSHLRKQAAVSSLLLAQYFYKLRSHRARSGQICSVGQRRCHPFAEVRLRVLDDGS
jgi:AbiV family abortive infection protein